MASIKGKITIFGTQQAKYRPFLGLVMHPLGVEFFSTLLDLCLIIWSCEDALTFSQFPMQRTHNSCGWVMGFLWKTIAHMVRL